MMETSSRTGATLFESVAERMGTRFECTKEVVSLTKGFQVDDVVLIISPDRPHDNWPLG